LVRARSAACRATPPSRDYEKKMGG
jgi:hypothetical protein